MEFDDFFERTLGERRRPLPYQSAFASAAELPSTVRVPTGLGKTATAVLGWLWRRIEGPESLRNVTPRRLVYCLPMRTLVEQTAREVRRWVQAIDRDVPVYVLMGGEAPEEWDLHPEQNAILIGTQDMVLSRALNRGYAMSRYRWPLPFAALNNDCLWILDEVQLMGAGVPTTTQLQAFRRSLGTIGQAHSVWMSATLQRSWLETVDLPADRLRWHLELRTEDFHNSHVQRLWSAAKPLHRSEAAMGNPGACASAIVTAHRAGTKTLAVFNTVKRARQTFERLRKQAGLPDVVLIHSRFRRADRDERLRLLLDEPEVIAVATQVIEAGVDVSATTLLTELAPWASLVQRFGRCNRRGDDGDTARVLWFDPGKIGEKFKESPPYEIDDLRNARDWLLELDDVSLKSLENVKAEMPLRADHVLRRRDLIDLFDTTPDLAGNDIDISRFIRDGEEHDVKVFWRDFDDEPGEQMAPHRDELCSVPGYELKEFCKGRRGNIWRWDGLAAQWQRVGESEIYPGQTYLIRASAGGYDSAVGWAPESSAPVIPIAVQGEPPDAYSQDYETGPWLSIDEHTDDVVAMLEKILASIELEESLLRDLRHAARWHDWGKAHAQFQDAFPGESRPTPWDLRRDVAKACRGFWKGYSRKGFRHELASALGMLALGHSDLSIYLAAAHHGKVRLSIRSMPYEKRPKEPERLFARGVWDGDELPAVELGGAETTPATRLSLDPMRMGRSAAGEPSWAERMLQLRDELGPFRLAYLEALLRAADMRASQLEARRAPEECP